MRMTGNLYWKLGKSLMKSKLMEELLETVEILSDPDMMENIREGLEDVKAGRVTPLRKLLKEEAR
jgi:hypothetical protein